jgi:hypothetical protein
VYYIGQGCCLKVDRGEKLSGDRRRDAISLNAAGLGAFQEADTKRCSEIVETAKIEKK